MCTIVEAARPALLRCRVQSRASRPGLSHSPVPPLVRAYGARCDRVSCNNRRRTCVFSSARLAPRLSAESARFARTAPRGGAVGAAASGPVRDPHEQGRANRDSHRSSGDERAGRWRAKLGVGAGGAPSAGTASLNEATCGLPVHLARTEIAAVDQDASSLNE